MYTRIDYRSIARQPSLNLINVNQVGNVFSVLYVQSSKYTERLCNLQSLITMWNKSAPSSNLLCTIFDFFLLCNILLHFICSILFYQVRLIHFHGPVDSSKIRAKRGNKDTVVSRDLRCSTHETGVIRRVISTLFCPHDYLCEPDH